MSPIDEDTHSLQDILRFVLTFARRHRAAGKSLSATCTEKLDMWRRALVAWLARLADKTVLALYLNNALSREQAFPAIHFNKTGKRKYTVVTPEVKWAILEDARANRASPTIVLALRSASAEYGCHKDVADAWLRKEQAMYLNRTGIGLSIGVHHFNLVSDPGQHNYKECLVSLLYCWEISQGMRCPWQHLVPGKVLTPLDVQNMDPELCRYAGRHKLDRVASYRQLQGYSNQLRVMSSCSIPPLTLSSFKLPESFNVRPVKANERRKTVQGHDQDVSYIVNTESGVRTRILPPQPIKVRLLTLELDQGSIGCAGAAFVMFYLRLMVMAKFDKIHRLIRDIKGAENNCCKKIFTKAKLWSAYLYSINKRPFGKGGNATLKQR